MGYGVQIPAHQLSGPKMAWDFRGYGLLEAWVKRVLTVDKEVSIFGHIHKTLNSVIFNVIINSEPNCYFLPLSWQYFMQILKYAQHSENSI